MRAWSFATIVLMALPIANVAHASPTTFTITGDFENYAVPSFIATFTYDPGSQPSLDDGTHLEWNATDASLSFVGFDEYQPILADGGATRGANYESYPAPETGWENYFRFDYNFAGGSLASLYVTLDIPIVYNGVDYQNLAVPGGSIEYGNFSFITVDNVAVSEADAVGQPVPEPGSLWIVAVGCFFLGLDRRLWLRPAYPGSVRT